MTNERSTGKKSLSCLATGREEALVPRIRDLVIPPDFYRRDTIAVARDLIGRLLVHRVNGTWCGGYIVETEAYLGPEDLSSHAAGKRGGRNAPMFGPQGHAYVYFIYGMYDCFNVVAYDPENREAGAVLIRALEPAMDIKGMHDRRKKEKLAELTSGPGKVCQALSISRNDSTLPLWEGDLLLLTPPETKPFSIEQSTRIGISKAVEFPYRFFVGNCPFVSTYRKSS